jgi:hypothetical protein
MFNELTFQAAMIMGAMVGGSRVGVAARRGRDERRDRRNCVDEKVREALSRGYFG